MSAAPRQRAPRIESEALRRSAMGEECTLRLSGCQGRRGVVLAHVRRPGTGMGRKPDDLAAVFACHRCHDVFDGRHHCEKLASGDVQGAVVDALIRTHRRMWELGLLVIAEPRS